MTGSVETSASAIPAGRKTTTVSSLRGGGEMGQRIRELDWAAMPLGDFGAWPQALSTLVEVILGSNQPMFVVWGPEHTLLYNEAYAHVLAAKHPAALGQPFLDVWHEIRADLVPIVAQAYRGEPVSMDDIMLVMHRKGYPEETHFAFSYTPVRGLDGQVGGFLCACFETTAQVLGERARQRAEDALRELNETLEQQVQQRTSELNRLWDTSPDLLLVIDFAGVFRRVNPAWTTLLGYRPDELVGHHVNEFVLPDDHADTVDAYNLVAAGGLPRIVNRYRHKDGSTRWISWVAAPAEDRAYAFGRDVTGEKQRDALLRDTQEFARLALSAVGGVGVWTYEVATDLFFYDAAIAELYAIDPDRGPGGIPRAEFLANVHTDDRAALTATMSEGLAQAGDLELEYRLCHPDGSVHWVLSRGHTYHDAEGRPIRRTGVGVDTTSQRQTEEALRQSQKLEAIGQLTGGVAHDFNNLLTVIKSSTDLLQRPDLPDERRTRYVAVISDTVDRAAKLTGQLLAFARRQSLRPEVFAACDSVRSLSAMMETLTGSRIQIVTELPEQICFVEADPSQFDTALVNMAVNARDAMDGEGRLTIRVEPVEQMPAVRAHAAVSASFVAVSITDTGSGIPPERLEQIFEPFFTTKGVGQGTGLGLSQVFGFTKQSGGEVTVTSEVGRGSTFTLYLPRVAAPSLSREDGEPEPLMDGHGTCVLVVEDNVEVGTFAVQTLTDLGYMPVLTNNAEAALAELAKDADRFDVVFSDVVMPGMNGIDLAHRIREEHHDLPVLLASGYSHVLAQNGTYGFELLHKPYSVEQLSRLLRKVATWQRRKRIMST